MTEPATETPTGTETTSTETADLGDAGKRALQAERTARNAAEQQLKALNEQLAAATTRATALEAANNDLTSNLTAREQTILRQNIGLAKKLPPELIDRLRGDDEASLSADADALLALIPATTGTTAPRPDPSQGSRGPASTDPATAFAAALRQAQNRTS